MLGDKQKCFWSKSKTFALFGKQICCFKASLPVSPVKKAFLWLKSRFQSFYLQIGTRLLWLGTMLPFQNSTISKWRLIKKFLIQSTFLQLKRQLPQSHWQKSQEKGKDQLRVTKTSVVWRSGESFDRNLPNISMSVGH